jgi:hypothetical protein
MNIFFLDYDVDQCAKDHCDKHCVKMILEHVQMLCTTHHVLGNTAPYKKVHVNHPCTIWVRESLSNYLYLTELTLKLCEEYTERYGKRHKSEEVLYWCIEHKPNIKDVGFTEPAKAMPDEYKVKDVIQSYRNYYNGEKIKFAKWKNGYKPVWLKENPSI